MNQEESQIGLRVRVEGAPHSQGAIAAEPRLIDEEKGH